MDREDVVHTCNDILLSRKKKTIVPLTATCMDQEIIKLTEVRKRKTNIFLHPINIYFTESDTSIFSLSYATVLGINLDSSLYFPPHTHSFADNLSILSSKSVLNMNLSYSIT